MVPLMLKTNEARLVKMAVQGSIIPPPCFGWEVTRQGIGRIDPSVGGITYNVKIGDSVFGWEGYGWSYKKGAVSIAVVVHGDSHLAGHGPGVQTVMTSRIGAIEPVLSAH